MLYARSLHQVTPPARAIARPPGCAGASQRFDAPQFNQLPLDRCTEFASAPWASTQLCGEPAATAWCRLQGFRRAVAIGPYATGAGCLARVQARAHVRSEQGGLARADRCDTPRGGRRARRKNTVPTRAASALSPCSTHPSGRAAAGRTSYPAQSYVCEGEGCTTFAWVECGTAGMLRLASQGLGDSVQAQASVRSAATTAPQACLLRLRTEGTPRPRASHVPPAHPASALHTRCVQSPAWSHSTARSTRACRSTAAARTTALNATSPRPAPGAGCRGWTVRWTLECWCPRRCSVPPTPPPAPAARAPAASPSPASPAGSQVGSPPVG